MQVHIKFRNQSDHNVRLSTKPLNGGVEVYPLDHHCGFNFPKQFIYKWEIVKGRAHNNVLLGNSNLDYVNGGTVLNGISSKSSERPACFCRDIYPIECQQIEGLVFVAYCCKIPLGLLVGPVTVVLRTLFISCLLTMGNSGQNFKETQ